MKNKYLLSVCAILFGFVFSTPVKAQVIDESTDKVVWLGTSLQEAVQRCANGEYVYLYNVEKNMFINAGASYGVQGVLSTVGMRMKLTAVTYTVGTGWNQQTRTGYTVATRVHNESQGHYMSPNTKNPGNGTNIYLDRINTYNSGDQVSFPNWSFAVTEGSVNINDHDYDTYTYRITNNEYTTYPLGSNNDNLLVFSNTATQWRIVTEADYIEAMNNVVWGEVDLGSFVQDAEFGRDNMDARYWVWEGEGVTTGTDAEGETITLDAFDINSSPKHWHQRNQDKMVNGLELVDGIRTIPGSTVGPNVYNGITNDAYALDNYRDHCAKYYAAEIYNEEIKLYQTIDLQDAELTEGLYKMTCQALYYDDGDGLTNDDVAFFFVTRTPKDGGEPVTESLPIIPMNKVPGNNITPHSGVSAGYVFDTNAKAYLLEFYVEVKEDMTLTFGIDMQKAQGWAVIGNIHMYANGKQAIFLDEDWRTEEQIEFRLYEHDGTYVSRLRPEDGPADPYDVILYNEKYDYPVTLYYQRTMTKDKWNTICLPLNLTGAQVRQAFGNDCDMAEIDELEVVPSDNAIGGHYTIHFKGVDLDTEGIMMGKPYIIKPTNDPQVVATEDQPLEVEFGNGKTNQVVPITGPIYTVLGVTKKQLTEYNASELSDLLQTAEGKTYSTYSKPINFTGTFYRKEFTANQVKNSDDHMWFITKGNMYHLQGTKAVTLWATYAYLHAPKASLDANISNISISLDGITDTMTSIDEMPIVHEGNIDDASIYNLAGQKMESSSLSTLPRGIYIVNGRKYSVK